MLFCWHVKKNVMLLLLCFLFMLFVNASLQCLFYVFFVLCFVEHVKEFEFRVNTCQKHQICLLASASNFGHFERSAKWAFRLDGKRIFICWWFKRIRVCEGTGRSHHIQFSQCCPKPKKCSECILFKKSLVSELDAEIFRNLEKKILRAFGAKSSRVAIV